MDSIFSKMSDSIHYLAGELSKFPVLLAEEKEVNQFVQNNIEISKKDWDSFETSWDFTRHPLLPVIKSNQEIIKNPDNIKIAECYKCWEKESNKRFSELKINEEELNRIYIKLYGLQNELTAVVEDVNITICKADLKREIRSFISYAVGCMFGRYSLKKKDWYMREEASMIFIKKWIEY